MAQTSLKSSDDIYCPVNDMWWCWCVFDVGCWMLMHILYPQAIFHPLHDDDAGDGCGGWGNFSGGFCPMIDWEYQRRPRGGKNQSHGPNRQLRTRAWTGTWWTPEMWRHDGDSDIRCIFSEVTGLNRAISAGPPSTKIMLTMSLPMWRFRSTWKYQSNKEEHSSSRLAGKNV